MKIRSKGRRRATISHQDEHGVENHEPEPEKNVEQQQQQQPPAEENLQQRQHPIGGEIKSEIFPSPKRQRLENEQQQVVAPAASSSQEQGSSRLHSLLGLGLVGRKVLLHPQNVRVPVPERVTTTVQFREWLKSLDPPVEEILVGDVWEELGLLSESKPLPSEFHMQVRQADRQAAGVSSPASAKDLRSTLVALSSRVSNAEEETSPELAFWEEMVVKRSVPRMVVEVDSLLEPQRPWVSEFRYLHFLFFESTISSLSEVQKMRRTRLKDQDDLEVPYQPLFLKFCLGAAAGQTEVKFFKQAHQGSAREDICLQVQGTSHYCDVKATFQTAIQGKPQTGLDRNKEAFARMLKCNYKSRQPWHLGIFGERAERLWFALFEYKDDGRLQKIRVTPEFPCSERWNNSNLLLDMKRLKASAKAKTLCDVVSPEPPPGFKLLVRYMDTLCKRLGISLQEIRLKRAESEDYLDLSGATVVSHGHKSLILQSGSNVVKVSDESLVKQELAIHAVVDGLDHIRPVMPKQYGVVEGAGDGLHWFVLRGFGRPVAGIDMAGIDCREVFWRCAETAVFGMHEKDVFHRDIKPGNFLLMGQDLELNDFDSSCFVDAPPETLKQLAGTLSFRSPFIGSDSEFTYRDDWCSLVLTFLWWYRAYASGGDKSGAMERAREMESVPKAMKECIRWIFSAEAACGNPRPRHES